ncbi:MAG: fibronectin type III domain-containing protein [Deltaproteobacteria bacterium]|nr:fibronectin type III domain-containing protein [Deltaproteobacteria bacterium]
MRCISKSFKLVLGGILFLSLLAGCGDGAGGGGKSDAGGGGSGTNTSLSSSELPPPQTSVTDSAGQAMFLTSQGGSVTFEVVNDTQQAIPDASVIFAETQNNNIISEFKDPLEEYVPMIFSDSILVYNQTTSSKALTSKALDVEKISAKIVVSLLKTTVLKGLQIYRNLQGTSYKTKIGDYNNLGGYSNPQCVTVKEYVDYVNGGLNTGRNFIIDLGTSLLNLSPPVGIAVAIIKDFILNPLSDREGALIEDLYKAGIINKMDFNEKIRLEIIEPIPGSYANSTIATDVIILPRKPETGECEQSNVQPSVPTNLNAAAVSSNQINLTWNDTNNESGYNIEYSLDGNTFKPMPVCVGKDTISFTHQFLSSNTTYYYRISAINSAGSSGYSSTAWATTLLARNQNPVISSVTATYQSVNPGGTSAVTCYASDPDGDSLSYVWTKTGGSISGSGSTVTWTAPSTPGIYTVLCNVSDGKSSVSSNVNINVSSSNGSPPGAFTLSVAAGCNGGSPENQLTWIASSGATGYYTLYRCAGTNCTPTIYNASATTGTTFKNTSVTAGTTYTYFIRATNAYGSTDSNWITVGTQNCSTGTSGPPGAFTLNVTAGCSGSSPENQLSWATSSGATGYYAVYRCTGSSCTPTPYWQNATAVPNTTFRNSSVTTGDTYTYFVRASNTYGYTDSNLATVTTRSNCGSTPNNSPTISSVIPNPYPPVNVGSTLAITCVASDPDGDALTYTWTSTGGNFSGSGSVVSWIAPSTAGTYTVTCSVSDGKGGNDSQGISISVISSNTNTPPIAPSNLVGTALSQNNIALVWQDNSDNETGFKIERKAGATGTYSQITTVAAQASSGSGVYYDDSGLIAGTTYCYRVRAYNTYDSSYSNENCATTQAQQGIKPTAVTGSATNITSNSATLNGTVNPNGVATGAFFQYGTSTAFGYTTSSQVVGSGTNSVNVTANLSGLSPNTVYYFRIVATNSLAETTFGATQTFVTTSSGGSLPGSFTLSGTAGCSGSSPANYLSWTASSGVASYAVYRCTGSGCTPTWYYNLTTLGATFTNTNVVVGATYTYFIRATNSYGYTDSNWVTITTRSSCP